MPQTSRGEELVEEAMIVRQEGRAVVITGPGPVAIAMTPEAAEASARRLLVAAEAARRDDGPPPVLPIDQI